MPKNRIGGNKAKKGSNNIPKLKIYDELDKEQLFGKIIKNNGSHFEVLCSDDITRSGKLSSSMKKIKARRVTVGCYVIISLRTFETTDKNCDILGYAEPPDNIVKKFNKNDKNTVETVIFDENDKETKDENNSSIDINDL